MIKIKIKTLNPQRKNRGHWASSDVMDNDVISDDVIFSVYNFIIKPQYKFAIFCKNLKILCREVSEILD